MDAFIRTITTHRLLVLLVAIAIGIMGVMAFQTMSIDAYPDISGVQVQIITAFPGRAAEEVEQQVTIPLERIMSGLPRAEAIRSRTIFGLSLVQIIFEPEAEDYWARNVVYQKLSEAQLPNGAAPSLASLSTAYGEIYRYELTSKTKSPMELRTLNDWVVIPRLLKEKGVVEVANFGGLGKQFAIQISPEKMLRFGVRLQDIAQAVRVNNSTAGGSFIERGSTALVIRGLGRVTSIDDLNSIYIKNSNGTQVFVHDVGQAVIDALPQTGIFGRNEKSDGVEGIVRMRRGENPSDVLVRLKSAVTELDSTLAKDDVQLTTFYDRSTLVEETLHTVSHNVIFGIVLVVLTLLVFLGSARISIAVALAIPFSLLWAFLIMKLTGIPVSLLSIGAVDFGIIVDGAIIMAEGMVNHLSHDSQDSFTKRISAGFSSTYKPMTFSMVIIIIAYVPLLSLRYIEGLLFKPMAITLCYSLFGALLFSTFILPVLFSFKLFRPRDHKDPKWILKLSGLYERFLTWCLPKAKWVLTGSALVLVIGLTLLLSRLGSEFLPYMDEGVFWLRANFPEGISLKQNSNYASQLRKLLTRIPEISFVTTQAGRSDTGTDPFPMNRVEMMVGLKDKDQWRSHTTKLSLESEIRTLLEGEYPTTRFNLTQPIIDSVTEDTNGTSANLAVEILGEDLPTLRKLAEQTARLLRSIPGSVNVNLEQEGPQPQLRIDVDHHRLSNYQLSSDSVNDMINTALGGLPITEIYEGIRRFDVVVKYAPAYISSPFAISSLPIFNENGQAVPIGQVANIKVREGETIIARSNVRRRITVRLDIRDRSQGDFVKEAQRKFASQIKVPSEYKVQWLGMFENLQRARKHFAILIPVTIFLIAAVLFFSFGSLIQVALVFLTTPFAVFGALLFLSLRGMPFSVSAGVGLASLFGVASMYGILLVNAFRTLLAADTEDLDAPKKAALSCIRPILLTAAVAIIGLIPAMLSQGIGSDVQRPIATAIVGGLLFASILSLLILPCAFLIFRKGFLKQPNSDETNCTP